MKTSTIQRATVGAAVGISAALTAATPAWAVSQDGADSVDHKKVIHNLREVTAGDGVSRSAFFKPFKLDDGEGYTWYRANGQAGEGQSTYMFQPADGRGLSVFGGSGSAPSTGSYRLFAPTQSSRGIYTWSSNARPGASQFSVAGGDGPGAKGLTFSIAKGQDARASVNSGPRQDVFNNARIWTTAQDGQSKSESVEVHVVNDDITVRINGEEIPEDRIKRDGGRIIILDENGDELRTLNVYIGGGADAFTTLRAPEWQAWQDHLILERAGVDPFGQPLVVQPAEPKVMIGIHMDEPGAALRRHLRLGDDEGVMVIGVLEGLPAHEAGIDEFDVIVEIVGQPVGSAEDLRKIVNGFEAGDIVEFEVIQSGRRRTIEVEIDAYDRQRMSGAKVIGSAPNVGVQNLLVAPGERGLFEFDADGGRWLLAPGGEDEIMRFQVPRDLTFDRNLNAWRDFITTDRHFDGQRGRVRSDDDAPQEDAGGEPDDQLERLDQRIAELERLLDRLIEQANRGGGDN